MAIGWDRVLTPIDSLLSRQRLRWWGARVGRRLVVHGRLRVYCGGSIEIGDDVRINSGRANFVGIERRMALWVGRGGQLSIGAGCAISNSLISCRKKVAILEQTFIGGGCDIWDNDFHAIDPALRIAGDRGEAGAIVIGPRAFVGARSVVLKNVTIGEGAVIAAGSVVTRSVPAFEIWGGVPARLIRRLEGAEDSAVAGKDMAETVGSKQEGGTL